MGHVEIAHLNSRFEADGCFLYFFTCMGELLPLPADQKQFVLLSVWMFSREKPDLLMVDVREVHIKKKASFSQTVGGSAGPSQVPQLTLHKRGVGNLTSEDQKETLP